MIRSIEGYLCAEDVQKVINAHGVAKHGDSIKLGGFNINPENNLFPYLEAREFHGAFDYRIAWTLIGGQVYFDNSEVAK